MLGIHARVLQDFYVRGAHGQGIPRGRTGLVTVIQRFGSSANLNVHFHTLALDGVFTDLAPGRLQFHAAPAPSDAAVARVLAAIRSRVGRLLARRGPDPDRAALSAPDGLADVTPILAQLLSASVQGHVALGRHAGTRVARLREAPPASASAPRGPRQAHLDGFDLHANVRVPANDRARLEHLCRYLLRPPLIQDRLRLRADGRVAIRLKRAWRDGTTQLVLEPLELLAKLAALTPRPEVNLLLYHGLLAPHARGRHHVVRYGRPDAAATDASVEPPPPPRHNWTWAALMRRAFGLDVLACPRCGGRLRVIATVADLAAVRQILATRPPGPPRGPGPPAPAGSLAAIR